MYKCSECGNEFKDKPDYCDCGNDIFEKIVTHPKKLQLPVWDILARSFFACCLLLSVIVWFISIPESKDSTSNTLEQNEDIDSTAQKKLSIPSLDAIWKESVSKQPIAESKISNDTTYVDTQNAVTVKKESKLSSVSVNKSSKNPKAVSTVKTGSKTSSQSSSVKSTKSSKNNTQNQASKVVAENAKKSGAAQTAVKNKQNENIVANQELTDYKVALRKSLFRYIDFTKIQGEGKCVVEFSIDSSGKFLNRRFVSQSSNESVNGAVYNMMMSMPKYYPPPEAYHGENIKMSFYFKNGYYEINYL